jgi:hypothetical protein
MNTLATIDTRITDLRILVSIIDRQAEDAEAELATVDPGTVVASELRARIDGYETEARMYYDRLSRLEVIRNAALAAAAEVPCG